MRQLATAWCGKGRRTSEIKTLSIALSLLLLIGSAAAQVTTEVEPLPLDEIVARGGQPLDRDAVVKLVTGANVVWSAHQGGERRWTNEASGEFWGTRVGIGMGSFNPHHKSSRGKWSVGDDGIYLLHLDYGHLLIEDYRWQFFSAGDHILMNSQPPVNGSIRFYR